jgi:hypothetical protein
MLRVGFKPTITAFERVKTVHALDRAATVIGEYGGWGEEKMDRKKERVEY